MAPSPEPTPAQAPRTPGGLSIRALVTLLVAVPMLAVALSMAWLTQSTARRLAEGQARTTADAASARAVAELRDYLDEAVRVSDLYALRLRRGELSPADLSAWEPAMLADLLTTPRVASIAFGTPEGAATMLMRGEGGRLELGRVTAGRNDAAQEFVMRDDGSVEPAPLRTYSYDPRTRPWYAAATQSPGPVWSPLYAWFNNRPGEESTLGTGYSRVIRDGQGRPVGVLVVDVTLEGLTGYLKQLPLGETGRALVIDEQNHLVASPEGGVVDARGERTPLAQATTPAARAAAAATSGPHGAAGGDATFRRVVVDGGASRVKIVSTAPHPGIAWRVATVLPEAEFLAEADRTRRHAAWLAGAGVLGSLALGLGLARWLARPVEALSAHVRRIGAGDFDSRLDLRAARELRELSGELNRAAAGLRHRMELEQSLAVAMEVQKSLLPERDPKLHRLEVAGRSTYCDATGGDYFDFIDARPLGDGQSLLVLGDVMGHGVPAALLMATARAALRAHALDGDGDANLAHLLDKVNRVLAADNRHQRFMTLSLLVMDPDKGAIRWASGGHDPAWLYRPSEGTLEELNTDDIPLGLDAEWTYREFTREGLRPGDVIAIGSDGVWDLFDPDGKKFGKDRLREVLCATAHGSAADMARALDAAMEAFRRGTPLKDDVTYVFAKVL